MKKSGSGICGGFSGGRIGWQVERFPADSDGCQKKNHASKNQFVKCLPTHWKNLTKMLVSKKYCARVWYIRSPSMALVWTYPCLICRFGVPARDLATVAGGWWESPCGRDYAVQTAARGLDVRCRSATPQGLVWGPWLPVCYIAKPWPILIRRFAD